MTGPNPPDEVWSGTYLVQGIAGSAFTDGGGPSDSRKWLGVSDTHSD